MKVYLAGYNADTSVLDELKDRPDLTPEVLSAAYARISRDPRPVNEIRKEARAEVERSRKSNKTIIFKMGHHSVAEHAVFNLDIIGVSRLVMEELEKFRLCSYTEKSQRYITLDKDHVIPEEIRGTKLEKNFTSMIKEQNEAYFRLFEKLKVHAFEKFKNSGLNESVIEGYAKEDARYITSLATESQAGLTVNARNLELMLRRFASHPLAETRFLGKFIYEQISKIAPSIVIFHNANAFDRDTYPELKNTVGNILKDTPVADGSGRAVQLAEYPQNGDEIILAALIHKSTGISFAQARSAAKNLRQEQKIAIFKSAFKNMQLYDSLLREFEYADLTYDIVLSSACFGQMKRHRMASITSQEYDPALGVTIPESIKETGMEEFFKKITDKTSGVYELIKNNIPLAAPYILTNAHRKRILMKVNARELYHISRLREDSHAQWDIRNVAAEMTEQAKKIMPLVFSMTGGKDQYNETYKKLFGVLPEVKAAALPGERSITP